MGGGGFMQHASNTNRKDRAQRTARRKKFKGDNSEQLLQSGANRKSLNFPGIPEEEALVRKRIEIKHQKNRKRNAVIIACAIAFVITTIIIIYSKTDGFEYW